MDDIILSVNAEDVMTVRSLIGDENQLIITNTQKEKSPDLAGFASKWWFNRFLSVRCKLNLTDPTAISRNREIKAFEPIMLTDVIPTSKKIPGFYDNVCVCLEGSVVEFELNSWGAAGYSFRIATQAGENIVKSLNHTYKGNYDHYETASIRRWQSVGKTIDIYSTNSIGIGKDKVIAYQKVTFKSCNIISYDTKDGKSYSYWSVREFGR